MLDFLLKYIGAFLIADITLMGSGAWTEAIGIPLRWTAFAVICLVAFHRMAVKKNKELKDRLIVSFLLISFAFIWIVFIPALGNIDFLSSLKDGMFFIGLVFIFMIAEFSSAKFDVLKIENFIIFIILILTLIHIALGLLEFFGLVRGEVLAEIVRLVLEPNQNENTQVMVGYMLEETFRVFWISSMFIFIGIALTIKNLSKALSWKNIGFIALLLLALFFTKTRSLIIASLLFPILFYLTKMVLNKETKFQKTHFAVIFLFLMPFFVSMLNSTSVLDFFGLSREISDNIRIDQQSYLMDSFFKNPILGSGFGSYSTEIRSETSPWSYELNMVALLMKIGISGLLLLYVTIYKIFTFYGRHANKANLAHSYALLLSIIFIGSTNPMLFNLAGLLVIFIIILPLERDRLKHG